LTEKNAHPIILHNGAGYTISEVHELCNFMLKH